MAAPKGNSFWRFRAKHGPDEIFQSADILREEGYAYLKFCDDNPRYSVEQTTGKSKPVLDDLTGQWILPEPLTEIPERRPYTLKGLCRWLGVGENFLRNKRNNPDISEDMRAVIEELTSIVVQDQTEGGLLKQYDPNFVARLNGIADSTKSEISGPNGESLQVSSALDKMLDKMTFEELYQLRHGKLPPPKK